MTPGSGKASRGDASRFLDSEGSLKQENWKPREGSSALPTPLTPARKVAGHNRAKQLGTERWEEMDGALHRDQDLAGIRKIIQSLLEKKRYLVCLRAS